MKAPPVLWVAKAAPELAPWITEVPYPTVPSFSPPSIPNPAPSAPKAFPVIWVVCVVVVKAAPALAPSITEVPYPTVPSFSPPSIPNPAFSTLTVDVVVAPKSTVPKLVVPKSTVPKLVVPKSTVWCTVVVSSSAPAWISARAGPCLIVVLRT